MEYAVIYWFWENTKVCQKQEITELEVHFVELQV